MARSPSTKRSAAAEAAAVVMGDIVGSEAQVSPAALHRTFNGAVADANKRFAPMLASPLTITLGDEFQGLVGAFTDGFELIGALRLALLQAGVKCRFVLGRVRLETPLNRDKAWNMMGAGLAAARDKLGDKRSHSAYRFSLPGAPLVEGLLDAVGCSLTRIEDGWTETQLDYVARARASGQTRAALAESLRISRRGLHKVLQSAEFKFYETQWRAVREALASLDQGSGP